MKAFFIASIKNTHTENKSFSVDVVKWKWEETITFFQKDGIPVRDTPCNSNFVMPLTVDFPTTRSRKGAKVNSGEVRKLLKVQTDVLHMLHNGHTIGAET